MSFVRILVICKNLCNFPKCIFLGRILGKNMNITGISLIMPISKNTTQLSSVLQHLNYSLSAISINYEIIFVGTASETAISEIQQSVDQNLPINYHSPSGKQTKLSNLLFGFKQAQYNALGIVDPSINYPHETIREMIRL